MQQYDPGAYKRVFELSPDLFELLVLSEMVARVAVAVANSTLHAQDRQGQEQCLREIKALCKSIGLEEAVLKMRSRLGSLLTAKESLKSAGYMVREPEKADKTRSGKHGARLRSTGATQ